LGYRPSSFEKEFLSAPIHSPLSGRRFGPSADRNVPCARARACALPCGTLPPLDVWVPRRPTPPEVAQAEAAHGQSALKPVPPRVSPPARLRRPRMPSAGDTPPAPQRANWVPLVPLLLQGTMNVAYKRPPACPSRVQHAPWAKPSAVVAKPAHALTPSVDRPP
jgi:hypothetical protein